MMNWKVMRFFRIIAVMLWKKRFPNSNCNKNKATDIIQPINHSLFNWKIMNDILTDIISATARNNSDHRYCLSMFYYASSVYLCRSLFYSCCCFDHIDRLLQNETHRLLCTVLGCALRSEKAKILLFLYNVTKKKINQATNPGLHYYYCYYCGCLKLHYYRHFVVVG